MPCAHEKHTVDGIVRNEPWVDYDREYVKVCHCEQCVHHGFAVELMEKLRKHFTGSQMQLVACPSPGTCSRGNSILINDQIAVLKDLENIEDRVEKELNRQRLLKAENPDQTKNTIKVCFGPSCGRREGEALEQTLWKKYKDDNETRVMRCGCLGACGKASNVVVNGNIISKQSPLRVINNVETELSKQRKASLQNSGPISMNEAEDILKLGF